MASDKRDMTDLVDSDDHLALLHPRQVLNSARNPDSHVELGSDDLRIRKGKRNHRHQLPPRLETELSDRVCNSPFQSVRLATSCPHNLHLPPPSKLR
jgi:hypothetical protein